MFGIDHEEWHDLSCPEKVLRCLGITLILPLVYIIATLKDTVIYIIGAIICCFRGVRPLSQYLVESRFGTQYRNIISAAEHGDIDAVREFLAKPSTDVNQAYNQFTALQCAAMDGNT
eukprot:138942_1